MHRLSLPQSIQGSYGALLARCNDDHLSLILNSNILRQTLQEGRCYFLPSYNYFILLAVQFLSLSLSFVPHSPHVLQWKKFSFPPVLQNRIKITY